MFWFWERVLLYMTFSGSDPAVVPQNTSSWIKSRLSGLSWTASDFGNSRNIFSRSIVLIKID